MTDAERLARTLWPVGAGLGWGVDVAQRAIDAGWTPPPCCTMERPHVGPGRGNVPDDGQPHWVKAAGVWSSLPKPLPPTLAEAVAAYREALVYEDGGVSNYAPHARQAMFDALVRELNDA